MKRTALKRTGRRVSLLPHEVRLAIFERDHFACQYCGRGAKTIDHILPKADRRRHNIAEDDKAFLVAACEDCNHLKSTRHLLPPSWASRVDEMNQRFGGAEFETWNGDRSSPSFQRTHLTRLNPAESVINPEPAGAA